MSDSCYPIDCKPPDFLARGISQARILEWVAISFSRVINKYCKKKKNVIAFVSKEDEEALASQS